MFEVVISTLLMLASPQTAPAEQLPGAETRPAEPVSFTPEPHPVSQADGYQGAWWAPESDNPLLKARYRGPMATFPTEQRPPAVYHEKSDRTYFVYAASPAGPDAPAVEHTLQMAVAYYDHATGTVPRPTILIDSTAPGWYGCPSLTIDEQDHLWVFVSFLGEDQPRGIFRSREPLSITAFDQVADLPLYSAQPWYIPGQGFLLLHGRRVEQRTWLHLMTSPDGLTWSPAQPLVTFGSSHDFVSAVHKNKIGIAFTAEPQPGALNLSPALYYMESSDFGKSWTALANVKLDLPLTSDDNAALLREYQGRRVFLLKDLNFDPWGRPIILFALRHRTQGMPRDDSRIWTTARWIGDMWEVTGILRSDHDYDGGSLHVERLQWRLYLPYGPGPEPLAPGGQIVMWLTEDQGRSWIPQLLTHDERYNHNHVRQPVNARDDFIALWSAGHPDTPSVSHLYLADKPGNVYRLPLNMEQPTARPELIWPAPATQPTEAQTQPADSPGAGAG